MREFEAYFGLYSLRQMVETEEIAWLNSSSDPWLVSINPDDKYDVDDIYERTFRNQYSQIKVGGVLFQPVSATEGPSTPIQCSENSSRCFEDEKNADWQDLPDGRRIHYKVKKEKGAGESGGDNVTRSYFKGKINCYKKKGALFSKRRTQMAVRIQGIAYVWNQYYGSCYQVHHNFDESRSSIRSYHRDLGQRWRRYTTVLECETRGTFTVSGNSPFTKYIQ